jgi:hypothetical protein
MLNLDPMMVKILQLNKFSLKQSLYYLGTNLISELFSTMTSRMRFTDVWNLVLGNAVGPRINEARQSAIEYLQ